MGKKASSKNEHLYISKKCHDCYQYVPLEATVCPSCKAKLGKIDNHGMAEKLTDWKGYTISGVLFLALVIYLKWAFF